MSDEFPRFIKLLGDAWEFVYTVTSTLEDVCSRSA